jgi:tight adherence protein B
MWIALIVLVGLAVLGLMEAGYHALRFVVERRSRDLRRRLQAGSTPAPLDATLLRQGRYSSFPALDAWLAEQEWARRIEHLLEQADSGLTVGQFVALTAIGFVAGATGGALLAWRIAVVLAPILAAVPTLHLLLARRRRSAALSAQLPEALEMMARSLRAGHALTASFQLVATEMPEPISVEFARAYEQQRLGMSLERAVREMAARAPGNGDLKIFAVSAVIQKETGGNLAEILDGIARTVRERYRFFGKLRALTAESRASAWVVSLTPVGIALYLVALQPNYMVRLVDNPFGQTLLMTAVMAWASGAIWFNRLTKFDF